MTLNAERLQESKKDIAAAVSALESGDDSGVSADGRSLVVELSELDDAAWDSLLAELDDRELRNLLGSIRQRWSDVRQAQASVYSPIRQVGHNVLFDVTKRSAMLRLSLEAHGKSLESGQDLEDTLWVGAAIVETVADAMQTMNDALNAKAMHDCIGSNFERNLQRTEEELGRIKELLESVRERNAS